MDKIMKELDERRNADAELAGTSSCHDDFVLVKLFLKHRKIAQDLQNKWMKKEKKEEEV
jgi:hypothetical protein